MWVHAAVGILTARGGLTSHVALVALGWGNATSLAARIDAVLFTRNPSIGEKKLYGEFLINAQGEDDVAGIRTPGDIQFTETHLPEAYKELIENLSNWDFGKRTGKGVVKIVTDMVNEGLVDTRQAIKMVEPQHLDQLLYPQFENASLYKGSVLAKGLPASLGATVGQIMVSAEDAEIL
ncbi:pyruvate, phosphate dikinase [Salvia divinorum]|uniref:Pyruvate, phosphate dikinase n=1 Tax=Salvia divinorum TaxID=28513 RepID=A0ABD1GYX4_SALDI